MLFEKVDDAACLGDLYHKGRQGLRLIGVILGVIDDAAVGEVDLHFVAFLDIGGGFGAFQDRQADVDGIAKEDARKGRCDHA